MTDAELIHAWRTGDEGALRRLVERWQRPLYGFLVKSTGSREDAEDLFQDTWVRLLGALPRYEERQQFKSLLFTVASRLAIDQSRRRGRYREESMEGDEGWAERLAAGESACPEARLERIGREEALRAAIDRLPDPQRQVVLLRLEADMSFQEIAEVQGAPLGTVLPRMHRAVKSIRRYIRENGHE